MTDPLRPSSIVQESEANGRPSSVDLPRPSSVVRGSEATGRPSGPSAFHREPKEFHLPAAELGNDGAILATLSSGLFRDGTIAGTFALGMSGYEFVCTGSSVKEGRLLRVFARRVIAPEDWTDQDTLSTRAEDFFRTDGYVSDYYGLIVEWQGRTAVLGDEIALVPDGKAKALGDGRISRPGEPQKQVKSEEWKVKSTPAAPARVQGSLF